MNGRQNFARTTGGFPVVARVAGGALCRRTSWVGLAAAGLLIPLLLAFGCDSDGSVEAVRQGETAGGQQLVDTVTVVGTATVSAPPDETVITVSVETDGSTPAEALDANSRQAQQIIDRLTSEGVAGDAIDTENVTVYPLRTFNPETGQEVQSGYRAQNTVTVTLSDLEAVGTVLAAAVEAGGTNVVGPEWRLADDSAVVKQALEQAAANARQKAEVLAGAAGVGLGDVLVLNESGIAAPPVVYGESRVAGDSSVAIPPVSPKDLEVTASVTATYRLER